MIEYKKEEYNYRRMKCTKCRLIADRDIVATINIYRKELNNSLSHSFFKLENEEIGLPDGPRGTFAR